MFFAQNIYGSLLLCSFRIQVEVKVTSREDMRELALSETRILLLYSTKPEARQIMEWAADAGLTGDSYVWVTTQSVIGESKEASSDFPAGMIGELTNFLLRSSSTQNVRERVTRMKK